MIQKKKTTRARWLDVGVWKTGRKRVLTRSVNRAADLRAYRLAADVTQREVDDNLEDGSYANWESGKKILSDADMVRARNAVNAAKRAWAKKMARKRKAS